LWRDTILLNQFHDILPGTSIAEVYETTKREYEDLAAEANALIDQRLAQLAGEGSGVTVFNTLGFDRDDVVVLGDVKAAALQDENGKVYPVQQTADGAVAYLENIPSKGYKTLAVVEAEAETPFVMADNRLETPFYSIVFDENGHFTSVYDKDNDRELVKSGCALNQMRLYEDKPIYFDNWDIDMYYTEKSWPVNELLSMNWIENGPVRATLELKYRCVHSTICQKVHFYANARRIDFETTIDWKEHQHLLKVEFPVDIHSDEATFDVQFGNVSRKIHTNTSWEQARFESCGQKWIDFSEGRYGVSILNDCKYGHSVKDGVVSLTLIKCGVEPNQNTDVEMHYFTYSLYPHAEDWRRGGTVQEGYKLNLPMYAVSGGEPGKKYSFASVDKDNVVLETVKQAEDGNGTVLRLYESHNTKTKVTLAVPAGFKNAYSTNLLEQIEEELTVNDGKVTFTIKPYEIMTILLK
jgi:alpha-mannosidase